MTCLPNTPTTLKREAKGKRSCFFNVRKRALFGLHANYMQMTSSTLKTSLLGRSQDKDLEMAVLFLRVFWSALFICQPLPVLPLPPGLFPRNPWEGRKPTVMLPIPQGLLEPWVGPPGSLVWPLQSCVVLSSPCPSATALSVGPQRAQVSSKADKEMLECKAMYKFEGLPSKFSKKRLPDLSIDLERPCNCHHP